MVRIGRRGNGVVRANRAVIAACVAEGAKFGLARSVAPAAAAECVLAVFRQSTLRECNQVSVSRDSRGEESREPWNGRNCAGAARSSGLRSRAVAGAVLGGSRAIQAEASRRSWPLPVLDAANELWGVNNIYSKGSRKFTAGFVA